MCLPYPLPSHHPACGCQEDRSLTVPIPHACACFCTLSEPLFIQAPRFTRWYGWFHLLFSEGEQLHIKSDIVSQERYADERREPRCLRFPSARSDLLGADSVRVSSTLPIGSLAVPILARSR